jgi:hypothetical protein
MPIPASPTNPPAIHGKDGLVCISLTTPGTPAALTLITDWTLDMATDMVETTALGDSNKTYVKGLKDVKGTFSGQLDITDDLIFEAADQTTPIQMAIYPTKNNNMAWTGPAYLDVSVKGGATASVTVDGNFTAAGGWSRTAPGTPV